MRQRIQPKAPTTSRKIIPGHIWNSDYYAGIEQVDHLDQVRIHGIIGTLSLSITCGSDSSRHFQEYRTHCEHPNAWRENEEQCRTTMGLKKHNVVLCWWNKPSLTSDAHVRQNSKTTRERRKNNNWTNKDKQRQTKKKKGKTAPCFKYMSIAEQ
jgi:hypothetical protein